MADDKKKKPIDIVLDYILENHLRPGKVVNGGIVGKLAEQYISIGDDGFDIFTVENKTVKEVQSYDWSEFDHVTIDKMALSVRLALTGNKSVHIHIPDIKDAEKYLSHFNIKSEIIKRKWYRKIPGFRSGKVWKMVVAVLGYCFIFYILIFAISATIFTNSSSTTVEDKPDEPKAVQAESKPAEDQQEKESSSSEDQQEKESSSSEAPKALNEALADQLTDELGDESNMGKKLVVNIEVNDHAGTEAPEDKIALVTLFGDENLNANMTKKGMLMDSPKAFKQIFSNKDISEATLFWQQTLVDAKGNESDENVLKITLTRENYESINWDNFDYNKFEVVADNYYVHPAMNN